MRIFDFVVFAMLSALSATSASSGLDVANIQKDIRDKGPKATTAALYSDHVSWDALTTNIASGNSKWIDVAVRLRTASDGGASSELQDALFAALVSNPRHVLSTAGADSVKSLCSGRNDPLATAKAALSEIDRVQASVSQLDDKNLGDRKKDCLVALKDAKANAKRFFKD